MERRYWTLLTIDAAGPQGLSPVQLQKSLFLLGKNLPSEVGESFYQFEAYNYGPFDAAIYVDARVLVNEGLVATRRVSGQNWGHYIITPEGTNLAQTVKSVVSHKALDYIGQVVSWVQHLSFVELVNAIYRAYPEYQVNSVFIRR